MYKPPRLNQIFKHRPAGEGAYYVANDMAIVGRVGVGGGTGQIVFVL